MGISITFTTSYLIYYGYPMHVTETDTLQEYKQMVTRKHTWPTAVKVEIIKAG